MKNIVKEKSIVDNNYVKLIHDLKQTVRTAQLKAHRAVNAELIRMYWTIGTTLLARQKIEKWGSKHLEQVSIDLKIGFPNMQGFSLRNLKYMRQFASAYPASEFGQQAVAQLPWGNIIQLIQKVKDATLREWYAQEAITNGWSRNVLTHMIESELHLRQKEAVKLTNFKNTLPSSTSDMAQAMFQDPYCLEFLNLKEPAQERDLEKSLVNNIRDFLLHLGKGFAFKGSQYKLEVGGDEFFIDMLFFNTDLNAHVVIELKTTKFTPADVGQLSFYVTAVDRQLKKDHHAKTIGILLCKSKNEVVAEYALDAAQAPIGISQYELGEALTQHLKILKEDAPEKTKELESLID